MFVQPNILWIVYIKLNEEPSLPPTVLKWSQTVPDVTAAMLRHHWEPKSAWEEMEFHQRWNWRCFYLKTNKQTKNIWQKKKSKMCPVSWGVLQWDEQNQFLQQVLNSLSWICCHWWLLHHLSKWQKVLYKVARCWLTPTCYEDWPQSQLIILTSHCKQKSNEQLPWLCNMSKVHMHKNYGGNRKKRHVPSLGSVIPKQWGTSF